MLARLQQSIVLVLLVVSVGWATCFWNRGWVVETAGAGFIVVSYLLVIAFEFWLLWRSASSGARGRVTFPELASAWRKEVVAAPQVFLWRQPFRSGAIPDRLEATTPRRRPVVFVHGFVCNRGLWNPWMQRLLDAQVPFIALSLEPVFGSIDAYAAQIDDAVRRARIATGFAPVVVAHSMGGLAVRAWLAGDGRGVDVHHVVTIGTPHHGTAIARHFRTTNTRQMRIGSDWLQALARTESPGAHRNFTCFWGRCDNIVFPAGTATLADADNRHLEATPHVRMAYHPAALAEVLRLVETDVNVDD